ncbi:hypothetical protein SCG7086_BN_00050 [Chlamydiales bacterium SCGC AG-110-P3]|nr:hypothetical protein SCG7086_BN_00050 [Chlamydiales bacterium SCGC AG-110-P3]
MMKRLLILFFACMSQLSAVEVFEHEPSDFHSVVECAGVFVESDGGCLFLLTRSGKMHAQKWGIPGGKLKQGESSEHAVVRETFEETSLNLTGEIGSKRPSTSKVMCILSGICFEQSL